MRPHFGHCLDRFGYLKADCPLFPLMTTKRRQRLGWKTVIKLWARHRITGTESSRGRSATCASLSPDARPVVAEQPPAKDWIDAAA